MSGRFDEEGEPSSSRLRRWFKAGGGTDRKSRARSSQSTDMVVDEDSRIFPEAVEMASQTAKYSPRRRSFRRVGLDDVNAAAFDFGPSESHWRTQRAQFLRLFGRISKPLSPRASLTALSRRSSITSPHTTLPPEIWIQIFHLAASPAHPFLSSSVISPNAPISFLEYPHSHAHLIPEYKETMRYRCSLLRVCRLWHSYAQEVVFEFVWITKSKEAESLVKLLDENAVTGLGREALTPESETGKQRAVSVDLKRQGAYTFPYDTRGVGRHIRRLHIETTAMDRCSPDALLRILEHASGLQVFSDYRSIRRSPALCVWPSSVESATSTLSSSTPSTSSLDPLGSSAMSINAPLSSTFPQSHRFPYLTTTSTVSSTEPIPSPTTSPQSTSLYDPVSTEPVALRPADHCVLTALLDPPQRSTSLRRLSWTSYDYDSSDYEAGVGYYLRVVNPKLLMAKDNLEFIELTLCMKDLGAEGGLFDSFITPPPPSLNSTSTSSELLSPSSPSHLILDLPALRSLKVTLDNATFHVLSEWQMPLLQNLSVISADFSYTGAGFAHFFGVHGEKIRQLELGHSSGAIEEHYSSSSRSRLRGGSGDEDAEETVRLAEWCPNLDEFICSADAEWNWEAPDWIAPHVLLPSHPTLTFIGVRDLEKRLLEGLERVERRDHERLSKGRGLSPLELEWEAGLDGGDGDAGVGRWRTDGDPWFVLLEQMGTLVAKEAFPRLRYVRDLSPESALMRRQGRVSVGEWSGSTSSPSTSTVSSHVKTSLHAQLLLDPAHIHEQERRARESWDLREVQRGRRVLRFWMRVMHMARERGVWIEDCEGVNVTAGELKRGAEGGIRSKPWKN